MHIDGLLVLQMAECFMFCGPSSYFHFNHCDHIPSSNYQINGVEIDWASVSFCLHCRWCPPRRQKSSIFDKNQHLSKDKSCRFKGLTPSPHPSWKNTHLRRLFSMYFICVQRVLKVWIQNCNVHKYIQICADSRKEDVAHSGWQGWPWRGWRSLIWPSTSVVRGQVRQVKG